jgi:hypothetical protein
MKSKPYDDERLGGLLALLGAAPRAWVDRAKRLPVASLELDELERMLEADSTFRESFDTDPVAATGAVGMDDLAAELERELDDLLSEEVVAHRKQHEHEATRLRALLLRSQAVRERLGL